MSPADTPTPPDDHDDLSHNMILPVGAMGIIGIVLITFLVFMAARWQDGSATERSVRIAVTMLDRMHRDVARTTVDYGRFLHSQADRLSPVNSAWLDTTLGRPVTQTHGYGWIIIIDGDNGFDYSLHDGEAATIDPARILTPAVLRLIGLARDGEIGRARATSGLATIDGEIQFVGAMRISNAPEDASAASLKVLLLATALDEDSIVELSRGSGLAEMSITPPGTPARANAIPLIAADGTSLGSVAWAVDTPGQKVFDKAFVLIVLATPALIGLAWVFVRRARDTVLIVIERERALRRERERAGRYLSIVGSIVVALDKSGRIEMINDRGCRLLGRTSEELLGCEWVKDFVAEDEQDEVREFLEELASGAHNEAERMQYRIVGRDREKRAITWQSTNVRDEHGTVTGILSSGDDITDRLVMEDKSRQQEAELAHFLRLGTMGEMATGLAHELNQPLAAITNYAQGCVRRIKSGGVDTKELLEALDHVNKQATRAAEIIKRIRGFVGKRQPASEALDINEAIMDVVEMIGSDLRRQGTELDLQLADDLPSALADMIQIEQVILNLIRNGLEVLKDSEYQAGRIRIASARKESDMIMVSVSDNGPGIDAKELESLFDPFYTTKETGLGMGLSISRSIVEAHKGALWAEAVGGQNSERNVETGTVFRFTLPIHSGSAATNNGMDVVTP
jgi:PAS domain S-box-containing protein